MDKGIVALRGDRLRSGLIVCGVVLGLAASAQAQGPQVDIDNPPGRSDARGKLGPALGASSTSGFDGTPVTAQQSIIAGRPGPGATRVPINQLARPSAGDGRAADREPRPARVGQAAAIRPARRSHRRGGGRAARRPDARRCH